MDEVRFLDILSRLLSKAREGRLLTEAVREENEAAYEGRPRRMAAGLNFSAHTHDCNVTKTLLLRSPFPGEALECTCAQLCIMPAARDVITEMGPGFGYTTGKPKLADVSTPVTDAEQDEWIATTLAKLDKKALGRLYRLLYNAGHRVNG